MKYLTALLLVLASNYALATNFITEINCRVEFALNNELFVGNYKVQRIEDESPYAIVQVVAPASEPSEEFLTENVRINTYTNSRLNQFLQNENIIDLAALAEVDLKQVQAVTVFEIEKSLDGSVASIVKFMNEQKKVLGASGYFGWLPSKCSSF